MPEEIIARSKYACPACGADAHWNAVKHALICPYCGTQCPAELAEDGSGIQEHDLIRTLRETPPEKRGWQTDRVSVKCQSCHAISVLAPDRVGQRCEFCGSAQLVPYEQQKAPIRPESLLPFTIGEQQARESLRSWFGSRWFAPDRLKSAALIDTVHGAYIPYWTFDAHAGAHWTAESGYHYYEEETYRDSDGKTKTRRVQRTRWVPSSGDVEHFFDDVLVPASVGVPAELLAKIEPFPTTQKLLPYDPGYLAGWVVEQYQVDLAGGAQESQARMDEEMRRLCASEVPGDTHRNLQVDIRCDRQTFKHVLLPVWLLTYDFGPRSFSVVINGVTGRVAGKHPLSWVKITLAVLAAVLFLLLLLAITGNR